MKKGRRKVTLRLEVRGLPQEPQVELAVANALETMMKSWYPFATVDVNVRYIQSTKARFKLGKVKA